ncbi:MAG TPA: hypothetical protein VG013_27445 [Gemmataceae bacterium]|nr:hypothetical protein [Gemmataceae bacterium]
MHAIPLPNGTMLVAEGALADACLIAENRTPTCEHRRHSPRGPVMAPARLAW